jgi:glycosyltransferase 2 family protein
LNIFALSTRFLTAELVRVTLLTRNSLPNKGVALGFKILPSSPPRSAGSSISRRGLSRQAGVELGASELGEGAQVSKGERGLRITERAMLASGVVLFCFLVVRLGADNVFANLRMIGWGILLIIAAEILAFLANTLGWRAVFSPGARAPSFGQLLLVRIAGDGVNYLTPTATMGGEFVRVRMLQGRAPTPSLAASVMVAKLTQTVGLVIYIASGLFIVLDNIRLPAAAKMGMLGSLALFAVMLFVLLFLQRRGLLTPALRLTGRWRFLRFLAPLRSSAERIDAEMSRVHRESLGRVVLSSVAFALGFACGVIESYLILWCFGLPTSFELALAIDVLGVALNNLMFFVPLRVGTQEAGKALVFAMLGLNPTQGLAAGVVCRIRELIWAFAGLAVLAHSHMPVRVTLSSIAFSIFWARRIPNEPDRDRTAAE